MFEFQLDCFQCGCFSEIQWKIERCYWYQCYWHEENLGPSYGNQTLEGIELKIVWQLQKKNYYKNKKLDMFRLSFIYRRSFQIVTANILKKGYMKPILATKRLLRYVLISGWHFICVRLAHITCSCSVADNFYDFLI